MTADPRPRPPQAESVTGSGWAPGQFALIDATDFWGKPAYTAEPVRWDGKQWQSLIGNGSWDVRYVAAVQLMELVPIGEAAS